METATAAGSIAISRGAKVIVRSNGDPAVSHSNTLLAEIDALLSRANIPLLAIELFAVAVGPGSFTGLRIGIATVKALASTLNRPCIGIPTLEAIAHAAGESRATVTLLPAGRGEVFAQMFSVTPHGEVAELDQPAHLSPVKLIEKYGAHRRICWAGEGAHVYSDLIREAALTNAYRSADASNSAVAEWRIAEKALNIAEHVASLAASRFDFKADLTANMLRAIYVRPSDAEMKCS